MAASAEKGQAAYMKFGCWQCHGTVGQGSVTGPKLAPEPMAQETFVAFVRTTNRTMPPYHEAVLSNEDLADIYAYVASIPKAARPQEHPAADPIALSGRGPPAFGRATRLARRLDRASLRFNLRMGGCVMPLSRRSLVAAACAGALVFAASATRAQDYPRQTIKIVVPLAAGGMADIFARTFAQKVSEQTGATIVVENRTGGGGAIGADAVAKSAPDGYTLLMGFHAALTILPQLGTKLPYDAAKDFTPVALVASVPNVLVVNPSLPAKSVKELVDYAKANPGKVTYASQGIGSTGHMGGEQFRLAAGVDIVHVPYRGAAPADPGPRRRSHPDDVRHSSLALPQIKDGKMRVLAIAGPQRSKIVSDVPTMAEAGVPGVEGGPWFGLVAPAGTPRPVIEWLNREAQKAFSAPDVRDRFVAQGVEFALGSPQDFAAYIAADTKRWGEVIRRAGITLQYRHAPNSAGSQRHVHAAGGARPPCQSIQGFHFAAGAGDAGHDHDHGERRPQCHPGIPRAARERGRHRGGHPAPRGDAGRPPGACRCRGDRGRRPAHRL